MDRKPSVDHLLREEAVGAAYHIGGVMVDGTDSPSRPDEIPIEELTKLAPFQVQALKSRWMTTVDAFVAAAATKGGQVGLCKAMEVEPDSLGDLLQEAHDLLGEDRFRILLDPKPGGPTGVLWDEAEPWRTADGSSPAVDGS
jgi:hypothetical protein